jgi:hypothetical protein
MELARIRQAMRRLSLGQLRRLDEFLQELIEKAEETTRIEQAPPGKEFVEERAAENVTYRLEGTRCGKEKCKCAQGELHGPYWYSYRRVEGRVKSQYVGKKLPRSVKKRLRVRHES